MILFNGITVKTYKKKGFIMEALLLRIVCLVLK